MKRAADHAFANVEPNEVDLVPAGLCSLPMVVLEQVVDILSVDHVKSLMLVCKPMCYAISDTIALAAKSRIHVYSARALECARQRFCIFNLYLTGFDTAIWPDMLPLHLRRLKLGFYKHSFLPHTFPPTLVDLQINFGFDHQLCNVLPLHLKTLDLGLSFNRKLHVGDLPLSLRVLVLRNSYKQPIAPGVLPPLLEELTIHGDCDFTMRQLPRQLRKLEVNHFDQPLEVGDLPPTLLYLSLQCFFDQPIGPEVLPRTLSTLKVGYSFNQPIGHGVLPPGLTTLEFGWCFNQVIMPGVLPDSLKTVEFGALFNHPLPDGVLPRTLKKLTWSSWLTAGPVVFHGAEPRVIDYE